MALRLLLMLLLFLGIRDGACSPRRAPLVVGLRLEEDPRGRVFMKERTISAPPGARFKVRLFGSSERLNGSWPWVAFATAATGEAGAVGDAADPCGQESRREAAAFNVTGEFTPDEEYSGIITVQARQDGSPSSSAAARDQAYHHLCVLSHGRWASVGPDRLRVNVESGLPWDHIPAWGLAVLVVALVAACGLLRTVNLSLLWLDPLELYVLHSCGSEEEKRSAKRLEPIRRRGNFLVRLRQQHQQQQLLPRR